MVMWLIVLIFVLFVVIYFVGVIWVVNVVCNREIIVNLICGLLLEIFYSVVERKKLFRYRIKFYCNVIDFILLYNVLKMVDGKYEMWW